MAPASRPIPQQSLENAHENPAHPSLGPALPAPLPGLADDLNTRLQLGREKARPCTTCHGLEGQRQGGEMPVIGGRDYFELLYQLGSFQRGERFQPAMTLLLQTYDTADLADVAAYFASLARQ
jgi:cytochrome c553